MMNIRFAYLLGLIIGNGTIQRGPNETTIVIEIPHKNFKVDERDVKLFVLASLNDIRNYLEPLLDRSIRTNQLDTVTRISFSKNNEDFLITEINKYLKGYSNHENMRIHEKIYEESTDVRIAILQGIADSTAYVRRSNYFFLHHKHRVYIEVPRNWLLVIDICNLLKSVDIPVQTIDFAHPNLRDGQMKKYNQGNHTFWKKEHQIKIWVNEFLPIGFKVKHKQTALKEFLQEFLHGEGKTQDELSETTHKFYWEKKQQVKEREIHPMINDNSIPQQIRGRQFSNWQQIANELGYKENN